MRQELMESYNQRSTLAQATQMLREAVASYEDPDYKSWQMLSSGATVGLTQEKDLTAQDAATVRRQAYIIYNENPYARGIVRTLCKFIFGKGIKTDLVETNAKKKKKAEEYLKEWSEVNRWPMTQKESSNRSFRDGEVFWYNRSMGPNKIPRLEFIEPDNVDNPKDSQSLGIEYEKNDPTTVKWYYVKKKVGDSEADRVAGKDVIHIKMNVDRNVRRGRSLFEPVFKSLKMHEDWLHNRMVLNKVRSAVALVRTVEGTQPQGQMIRRQTEDTSNPRKTNRAQMFRSGSIITAPAGTKYEMLSANIGASDAAQDGRNILLAIAVGVGFPEMFLTADFSNANYSSSLTAQNPFIREFEDWQDFFDFHIKALFKRVLEIGIDNGFVDKDTKLEVTNDWPPLVYEDFVANVTALGQLFLNEVISKHTYAARLGFDYDEEQEQLEQERAEEAENTDDLGFGGEEEPEEVDDLAASDADEKVSLALRRSLRGVQEAKVQVKAHQRKSKRGKVEQVKAHEREVKTFHGTSKENVESILKKGIKSQVKGYDGWVWITTDLGNAQHYGRRAAEEEGKKTYAVVVSKIPVSRLWPTTGRRTDFRSVTIHPDYIKEIRYYKLGARKDELIRTDKLKEEKANVMTVYTTILEDHPLYSEEQ